MAQACEGLKGGALISAVHAFAQHGNPASSVTLTRILEFVMAPIQDMIDLWMAEGVLRVTRPSPQLRSL